MNAATTVHEVLQHSKYLSSMKIFYQYRVAMSKGSLHHFIDDCADQIFPDFKSIKWPGNVISRHLATDLYLAEIKRLEPLLMSYIVNLKASSLKIDHTFKVSKYIHYGNGDPMFSSLLNVMNEYQEIVGYYLWTSKSLYQLKDELKLLQVRCSDIHTVFTDNPGSDQDFIHKVLEHKLL